MKNCCILMAYEVIIKMRLTSKGRKPKDKTYTDANTAIDMHTKLLLFLCDFRCLKTTLSPTRQNHWYDQ
jgi:hypothetical protein